MLHLQTISANCASIPAKVAMRSLSAPPATSPTKEPTTPVHSCAPARRGTTMMGPTSPASRVPTTASPAPLAPLVSPALPHELSATPPTDACACQLSTKTERTASPAQLSAAPATAPLSVLLVRE